MILFVQTYDRITFKFWVICTPCYDKRTFHIFHRACNFPGERRSLTIVSVIYYNIPPLPRSRACWNPSTKSICVIFRITKKELQTTAASTWPKLMVHVLCILTKMHKFIPKQTYKAHKFYFVFSQFKSNEKKHCYLLLCSPWLFQTFFFCLFLSSGEQSSKTTWNSSYMKRQAVRRKIINSLYNAYRKNPPKVPIRLIHNPLLWSVTIRL